MGCLQRFQGFLTEVDAIEASDEDAVEFLSHLAEDGEDSGALLRQLAFPVLPAWAGNRRDSAAQAE